MASPKVMAVIHYEHDQQAIRNAAIAADAGCHGVFLIEMDGRDELIDVAAVHIKQRHEGLTVGANRLASLPDQALLRNAALGLDATWVDNPGVSSKGRGEHAWKVNSALSIARPGHLFFGSVAFKYQEHEPDPTKAARLVANLGWIATTSGSATGKAPDVEKLRSMKSAIGSAPLAVASGITPENVGEFAPHLDWVLVATGVSSSFHEFDPARLKALVAAVR